MSSERESEEGIKLEGDVIQKVEEYMYLGRFYYLFYFISQNQANDRLSFQLPELDYLCTEFVNYYFVVAI